MMINFIAVFIGGGLGAVIRFLTGTICTRLISSAFPFATLLVNVVGSFILGFVFAYFMQKTGLNPAWKLALTVGFCGGLTTFSTFSFEVFEMLKNGAYLLAIAYTILSFILCVIAVWLGILTVKLF